VFDFLCLILLFLLIFMFLLLFLLLSWFAFLLLSFWVHTGGEKSPDTLCLSQQLRFQSGKFDPCAGAQTLTIRQNSVPPVPITCFCRRVDHKSHSLHQDINVC
jgi:hypothetical protein